MTTIASNIKMPYVPIKKNALDKQYYSDNKKDAVLDIIRRALKKHQCPIKRMHDIICSQWYNECKQMGFQAELLEMYVKGLGLQFKLFYSGLDRWSFDNSPNNILQHIDAYERIIVENTHSTLFLNEWKASKYSHSLSRYIDSIENGDE